MLHNLIRNFKAFEMLKGGRLFQFVLKEVIRPNRSQIRHKTHDMHVMSYMEDSYPRYPWHFSQKSIFCEDRGDESHGICATWRS